MIGISSTIIKIALQVQALLILVIYIIYTFGHTLSLAIENNTFVF